MAAWPAILPAPALSTLKEAPPNNVLRSTMDKGPAKLRRRTTANTRPLSFELALTSAELTVLDEFYVTDTFSGVDAFDYTHPRTGLGCSARFAEPPQYSEQEGVLYRVTVQLEILP